jgi:hypothetical protein
MLGSRAEAELEDKFIRPVLSALGFTYHVQPVAERGFKEDQIMLSLKILNHIKKPASLKVSQRGFSPLLQRFLKQNIGAGDLMIQIEMTFLTAGSQLLRQSNILKMYITILTVRLNGLYSQMESIGDFFTSRQLHVQETFEVDLEEIIKTDKLESFLYFYLFFLEMHMLRILLQQSHG